jgi:hypothetical protein
VESNPGVVSMVKRLRRASPKTGERLSFAKIAETLADCHLNENGNPYNPKSVRAMVITRRPKRASPASQREAL